MLSISSRKGAFAPQLTLANGSISGTYATVGTILYPARTVWFNNLTNAAMTFTTNTAEDQITVGPSQSATIDFTTNQTSNNGFYLPVNTVFSVKGSGASSGSVYISYTYGKD